MFHLQRYRFHAANAILLVLLLCVIHVQIAQNNIHWYDMIWYSTHTECVCVFFSPRLFIWFSLCHNKYKQNTYGTYKKSPNITKNVESLAVRQNKYWMCICFITLAFTQQCDCSGCAVETQYLINIILSAGLLVLFFPFVYNVHKSTIN